VDATGPMLKGARARQESAGLDKNIVYNWVNNPNKTKENKYFSELIKQKGSMMSEFPELKKEEIDAILDWADAYTPPVAAAGTSAKPEDNTMLFGLITLILALVAFILLQVNSNLRKLTDEKEGVYRTEPVPFYRNKTYLMATTLLVAALGGYFLTTKAVGLQRQQNYQPTQPIFYSHQVHAGTNQISCLYCHGSAQDSKTAGIPSVNVCMNCHMAVSKYEGKDVLVRDDGSAVDGNQEIQKLYNYAGWNPNMKKYNPDANKDGQPDGSSPIPWIKIHNLPDHVYFNHSQHIKVGKQQCQTCHGNIQEMPEVYQFSTLGMGWCINCHRETKVDFYNAKDSSGNKFYSIYEKFHKEMMPDTVKDETGAYKKDINGRLMIKPATIDSITVENIGGTECQKCHY
jgi:hypothetical protein